MENKLFLVPSSIVLAGVLITGAIVYTNGPRVAVPDNAAQVREAGAAKADLKIRDTDHVLGNPKAKVAVIEYSDFECPFCGRMFSETLPQIKENFIKTGDVKFIYRHFPLKSIHQYAQKAAEASECAGEQGKFWEYHDLVFNRQNSIGADNFKAWAKELGFDSAQFDSCLDSGKYSLRVETDLNEGLALGVNGTPATFVNGKLISGAQPYAEFERVIQEELK
ncbi:MAG: DsbA family protein [Patescibacteria group bacterium]